MEARQILDLFSHITESSFLEAVNFKCNFLLTKIKTPLILFGAQDKATTLCILYVLSTCSYTYVLLVLSVVVK